VPTEFSDSRLHIVCGREGNEKRVCSIVCNYMQEISSAPAIIGSIDNDNNRRLLTEGLSNNQQSHEAGCKSLLLFFFNSSPYFHMSMVKKALITIL
jgi:hypothetical protein